MNKCMCTIWIMWTFVYTCALYLCRSYALEVDRHYLYSNKITHMYMQHDFRSICFAGWIKTSHESGWFAWSCFIVANLLPLPNLVQPNYPVVSFHDLFLSIRFRHDYYWTKIFYFVIVVMFLCFDYLQAWSILFLLFFLIGSERANEWKKACNLK